jgi:hypothetical protein
LEDIAGDDLVGWPVAGDLAPEGVTLMSKPSQPLGDLDTAHRDHLARVRVTGSERPVRRPKWAGER